MQRIETSLTPKQAVLLWLKETRQLSEVEFLEKSIRTPRHELPRARIPLMVSEAVYESLCKRGMRPEVARHPAREAAKQTDFLIVLVWSLPIDVESACVLNAPYIVLLHEKFMRMLEQYVQCDKFEPIMWEMWRATLIERLCSVWQLRNIIDAISQKYFDHQPLLFPEQASKLDDQVQALEKFAKEYNHLEGGLPAWTAIDFEALTCSIQDRVLAEMAERVAIAKSESLEDFGEPEAASKIIEPYEVAMLERLRGPKDQGERR